MLLPILLTLSLAVFVLVMDTPNKAVGTKTVGRFIFRLLFVLSAGCRDFNDSVATFCPSIAKGIDEPIPYWVSLGPLSRISRYVYGAFIVVREQV